MDSASMIAYMTELSVYLSVHVLRTALFFKHEAYRNENEYRFLEIHKSDAPPKVERRSRSYELVKYRKFDWKRLQIGTLKNIVIGPAADRTKAKRFATDCMAACHLGSVEIGYSQIPYRAT